MVVVMGGVQLLLSDSHGIYIPKLFLESFLSFKTWGLLKSDFKNLRNPENKSYWDTWDTCLNDAKHTDKDGNVWQLWQDGDLWAVCYELMTDEEKQNFGFEG